LKNDTAGDTVDKKKLEKIKKKIAALRLRSNNIRSIELIKLAKSLGRKIVNRGHEPNYISVFLPRSRPISIPNHHGAMARFTAENILDQLEQDIFDIEESIERQDI